MSTALIDVQLYAAEAQRQFVSEAKAEGPGPGEAPAITYLTNQILNAPEDVRGLWRIVWMTARTEEEFSRRREPLLSLITLRLTMADDLMTLNPGAKDRLAATVEELRRLRD